MSPEPQKPGESKSLHREALQLGNREYTFEFRESARGNRFLSVYDKHERNGKETRDSILIFEDQLGKFLEAFNRAIEAARKSKK